jgi:hypothetical protein
MARFHAQDTFTIPSRDVFVIAGDVVEGQVSKGMTVHIPLNGGLSMTATITALEHISTDGPAEVGLVITANAEDRAFLTAQNIRNEDLNVTS